MGENSGGRKEGGGKRRCGVLGGEDRVVEDVDDADTHRADAGPSPAYVGIDSIPVHQLNGLPHDALAREGNGGNVAESTGCATWLVEHSTQEREIRLTRAARVG